MSVTNKHFLPMNHHRYSPKVILSLLLIMATGLRLYGIAFGFPDLLHVDEPFEIHRALRLAAGSYDWERHGKGGFYYFICLEMIVFYGVAWFTGYLKSPNEFAYFFVSNEEIFYFMARLTSTLFSILSIYVLYKIGRSIKGNLTGFIAAFIFTISGLSIVNAHYATVDGLLSLFILISYFYIFRYLNTENKKDIYLSTVFGGCSVITKLSGIVIILPILSAIVFQLIEKKTTLYNTFKHIVITIIILTTVTLIGEPGYIEKAKNFDRLINKLYGSESSDLVSTSKDATNNYKTNLKIFYLKTIRQDIGLPLLTFFGIAAIVGLYRKSKYEILLLIFIFPYFLAISKTTSGLYYFRYALPLIPLIILIISIGIDRFVRITQNILSNKSYRLFYMLCSVVFLCMCIPCSLHSTNILSRFWLENPRVTARKWIESTIPSGASILMEGSPEHRSQLFIPLVNSNNNIKKMIGTLNKDPGKKKYWKLKKQYLNSLNVPRYNLTLIKNDQTWIDYKTFKQSSAEYFVGGPLFIEKYLKTFNNIGLSRVKFYTELQRDPDIQKVAEFGNEIVIYQKKIK